MNKSDSSEYSCINLDDTDDLIVKKIEKAKTDSILGFAFATLKCRPEVNNLVNIYSVLSDSNVEKVCEEVNKHDMRNLKKKLADLIISVISPIREKVNGLLKDQLHLHKILKEGTEKAAEIANNNIKEINDIIGFVQ